ncbi:Putative TIM-barrel fold metal-dependent hydrolase [Rubrivivax sp. A210]|uniref:amidohydrolase family protein n=1 Tax=Rubrivivax sp. A210 TaxID=2772301 RepID=UPI001919B84B|nr:amidohydrolase family protein [Rubrivivax sp. A210]CAD5372299.1 Putative TIM-barrel fold metal-dependent hydrolase [Rubrivivax sp. A210]
MSVFDEPKIDCHCHVLDPARFAYAPEVAYRPAGQEIAPLAQYLQVMGAYGIRHALMVGPNSGYNLDNRCLLDALAQGQGRFKGIAVLALDTPRDELLALREQGMVGVAFNATVNGTAFYQGGGPLLKMLAELDMLLSLQVEHGQLIDLLPLLEQSQVRVLIDHGGRPAPGGGVAQPGFQALLRLARGGRAAVKLSGYQKFSTEAPPYADTRPFIEALLEAYTLDACLWASDWPFLRAPQRLDVGPLLRQVERLLPEAADRRKLFWDTPRRWLGF